MATVTWNAWGSSIADDLASSGGPDYNSYGAVSYNWTTASLWSSNSVPGAVDDVNAPDGAFLWITSPISVNSVAVGSSLSFPEVFADGSGALIQSGIFFSAPGVSTIASNFIDNGRVLIDGTGEGGTTLNIGGTLTINYSFQIGNVGITSDTTVTARAVENGTTSFYDPQGGLILSGSSSAEAKLDIQGAAGFGTDGVLTGKVELWNDAVIQFETGGQITDIASGANLALLGANARIADASAPTSNSALLGLSTNEGLLDLEGSVVHTTGDLTNTSLITLDSGRSYLLTFDPSQLGPHSGASLTVDGTLINSGTLQIRHLAGSLTSTTNVTVSAINNIGTTSAIGTIDVDDGGTSLTVTGVAGFGTVGVLTGQVVVDCYAGKGLIEFASGQITEIANGAALYLNGPDAFIADTGATDSNSALVGLTKIEGILGMNDGTLQTSGDLTNTGQILLGGAPTTLTITGVLTNSGYVVLGAGYGGGAGTISAAGLNNTGSIVMGGTLDVSGAVTNDGTITAGLASIVLGGPVSGSGSATIIDTSIEFGSAVAATETVVFNNGDIGHEATLAIDQASQFAGLISGFNDHFEQIHLTHEMAAVALPTAYSEGVTTLVVEDASSNIVATLRLQGDYRSDTFTAESDGGAGTYITVNGPASPSGSGPAVTVALANDTGSSSSDNVTLDQTLTGSGDPNAVVHFTVDGNPIADTATANPSGTWTFAPSGLADGSHTIVASETNAAGDIGSASITFTLDQDSGEQAALALTVNGNSATPIGAAGAGTVAFTIAGIHPEDSGAVTFTDANNHTVTVNINGGQADYVANLSSLADGSIRSSLAVKSDPAGNSFTPVAGNAVALDQDTGAGQLLVLDSSFGPKTLTADTSTGLEWLNVGLTAGQSYDAVASQLGAGQLYEGYRYATVAEVKQLWADFGVATNPALGIASLEADLGVGDVWYDGTREVYGLTADSLSSGTHEAVYWQIDFPGNPGGYTVLSGPGQEAPDSAGYLPYGAPYTSLLVKQGPLTTGQAAHSLTVNGSSETPIGAAGAGTVAFTVAGLDPEDSGTVTFADVNNNKVTVSVNGGQTSYTADLSSLADGSISSSLAVNPDPAGNSYTVVYGNAVTLDQAVPQVTEILTNDTGISATDQITSNDTLSGSGDPNASVHFTVDGTPIAQTATASASGAWSFTPAGLGDGSHTIVASETDAAGNAGTASVTFTLDTTDPIVSGIAQTGAATTNASTVDYIVTFSEAVTGVDASQFAIDPASTVSGASIAGVTAIDDSHYRITVNTGSGDGTVALDLIGAGIRDLAGNPVPGGNLLPQATYATGAGPISVVIGDVNGDGKPDLLIANGNSFSTATVLLGNGDGTFQPGITVFTGTSHQAVLGDVNGDGKLDIVSANSHEGTVAVLLGNGDGTFQAKTDYAAGANAISVAVADVNGDGKLDIATADYGANTDSILLGNGDGTFQPRTAYATGVQPGITVVADVNGDGKPDLVTINQVSSTVSVLLGNGDGTFQPQTAYATQNVPDDVVAADVNGDGKQDLITANVGAKTVSVLLGNGDGTFQPQTAYAVGDSPYSLAVGDINGDGKLDIAATALNGNTFSVLLGNGDGTFQFQIPYATGTEPSWVAIGDLSGDGRPDVVVTNGGSNNVSVFLRGSPTIAGPAYTIDRTAPAVTESLANDTGASSTDKLTSNDALSGSGDPNAVVHFTVDGTPIAQIATANASGVWSFTPAGLADGSHTILASETDAAGNIGTASLTFTLDTHGPTGWTFTLANSSFDGSNSIGSGTVIGSVGATGDPNSSSFTYFFAANQAGAGATQNLNGLSINPNTGAITTTAAISRWPTAWVAAEDKAGNIFAKQLVLNFGTSGADTMNLAAGTTAIFALGGSDTVTGTTGNDSIAAGAGIDTIVGFIGADTVNGGAGTDTISLAATSADLNAASDAQIVNVETISATKAASSVTIELHSQTEGFTINGSASGDVITGTAATDTISAGAGNDTIIGFAGTDTVDGGTGTDTIALTATSPSLNSASDKQIVNVEVVSAANAASGVAIDLHNQSEGFTITGGNFADTIIGTAAKDTIDGGGGADTLTGGAGKDVFVFVNKLNSLVSAYDTITDFTHGSDLFEIGHTVSASNFSALSHASTGNLLADLNTTLTTANLKTNGADLVTLTGTGADAGTYVIVNSGHGSGYLATADAVIKLQAGATVTAADFIA